MARELTLLNVTVDDADRVADVLDECTTHYFHADAVLTRLRAGTMPCDGAWPRAQVNLLQRWAESGKPG